VVSGSSEASSTNGPGAVATRWLVNEGVPSSAVTSVTPTNDAGALADVSSIYGHGSNVIVVTDSIDALWTRGAASSTGLIAEVSSPSGSNKQFYDEFGPLWHQVTGVAVGRIIGYGRVGWSAH
jgi:hypothetical protein